MAECNVTFKCPGHEFIECQAGDLHCKNCPDIWTKNQPVDMTALIAALGQSGLQSKNLGGLGPIFDIIMQVAPKIIPLLVKKDGDTDSFA